MPAAPHKASTSFTSCQNNPRPIPRAGRPQLHLPLSSLPTLLVSGTLSLRAFAAPSAGMLPPALNHRAAHSSLD